MAANSETTSADRAPASAQPAAPGVDLKKLAEKVYQLMLHDVRLAQVRGAQATRRKR